MLNNIERERKKRNLTQEELARKVGVTKSTIGFIEINKLKLSKKLSPKIAAALETTEDYLQDDDTVQTMHVRMREESKTIGNLIKSYRKLKGIIKLIPFLFLLTKYKNGGIIKL